MKRYFSVIVLGLIGCSGNPGINPDAVPVTGTVTREGTPVSNVVLNFQPASQGAQPRVATLKDGQFEVELNPGKYTYFFSEASTDSEDAKTAFKSIPAEFLEPTADREFDVQSDMSLELEIN